jgi:nucleotide-binding universal stress UspA family protein
MYKKILAPLDGSPNDDIVLDHVKKLAKEFGSTVTLILLFRLTPSDDPLEKQMQIEEGSSGWRAKRKAEKYLPELKKALADEGIQANTEFLVVEQPEPDAIVKYAEDNKFDLIIFANRERSPIGRFFFGNIEEKVRRRTSLPVLFVSARRI